MRTGHVAAGERRPAWQWGAGGLLLAMLGWFAFVRGVRVPLLGWVDLAIHEFGHLATFPLPDVVSAIMGNGTQTLLPLALAAVFALRERNWLGAVVCLGWAATTLQDASVYIADAPHQRLQLIGGFHDWAFVLGELGELPRAEAIARVVWTGGLMLWIVAAAGCALGPGAEPAIAAWRPGHDGLRRPLKPAAGATTCRDTASPAGSARGRAPHDHGTDWRRYFG